MQIEDISDRDDQIPKVVIIDEAWSMFGGGNSGVFIEKGYRRALKYNGAFVTGTQGFKTTTNQRRPKPPCRGLE